MIGRQLGSYEIVAKLGEGGMGEVYRARDTRLNRDVAIKILPAHLVGDSDRAARFEREAQTLASLNHPNIAHIYGTEQHALIMEFVAGDDLATRIARGPVELSDTLAIARQVALALEAAHAAGVIHRDLKPANIKVTADGLVKVLDFGLAKAMGDGTQTSGATMTSPAMTQQGVILGTAAYMSPEQARGRALDKRTDIWAFGAVLFEMLSGSRAFDGDNITDVLAAVVSREPDWAVLPASTPSALRRLIHKCLQRDPKNRLHDIADARIEIDSLGSEPADAAVVPAASHESRAAVAGRRSPILLAVGALAILAAGVATGVAWRASREIPRTDWKAVPLGGPTVAIQPKVSPDGHLLSFITSVSGQTQVGVMKPGTGSWTVVTKDRSRGLVNSFAWSIDGGEIYYDRIIDAPNGIYRVPALGGDERMVIEQAVNPEPMDDGSLVFLRLNAARQAQLHRFWSSNGKIEALPFIRDSDLTFFDLLERLDANHIVAAGKPIGDSKVSDGFYLITLNPYEAKRIATSLQPRRGDSTIATDRTTNTILLSSSEGNLYPLVRVDPRTGSQETLFSILQKIDVDVFGDGAIALSTFDRPLQIVRFDADGTNVTTTPSRPGLSRPSVALPDGRTLLTSELGPKVRVQILDRGREPVPFAQTEENTQSPFTAVGRDRVALMIGGDKLDIGIVSVATGAVVARVPAPAGVTSLGASPDGATVYWSAGGRVAAVPVAGGEPRVIGSGDSFVVDPDSGDLIVKIDASDGFRLERLSPKDGIARPIVLKQDGAPLALIAKNLAPGSVQKGRLVLPVSTTDSAFWFPAVLDLATGRLARIPVNANVDFHFVTWTPDGQILGTALGLQTMLWKFEKK